MVDSVLHPVSRRSKPTADITNVDPPGHGDLSTSCKEICSLIMKFDDDTRFYLAGMLHSVTQILRSGEAKNVLGHPPTVEELHDAYLLFRQCYRAPVEEPEMGRALSALTQYQAPKPATSRIQQRSRKRLLTSVEQLANKPKPNKSGKQSGLPLPLRGSPKVPPSCTFCRDPKHRNPHCPKKKAYGRIIVSEEKQEYLNYLKEKCPIHNEVVDKHMLMDSFTTRSWKHLQVKSIHPTVTTNDGIPVPAHFLAAKIATIGGKTHDFLPFAEGTSRERYYAYITMTCLESIIHQVGTTRLIFDRTGDDSIGSSYRPRDQLPNRQAERYSHRDQIPYRQAERYPYPSHHRFQSRQSLQPTE